MDDELIQFKVVLHNGQKVFKDEEPAPGQPWRTVPVETGSVIKPREEKVEEPPKKWWHKWLKWFLWVG